MKLSTSTGDFSWYAENVAGKVKYFRGSKFKYINLEQTGAIPEFLEDSDFGWRKLAEDWQEAAEYAGVTYVVSHAPCLNVFERPDEEDYAVKVRAIRRSIEICGMLKIPRIVVHMGMEDRFSRQKFFVENKKFYEKLFDVAEKHNVMILTENDTDSSYEKLSTGKEMREFIDYVDHPLFAACWDTAHGNLNEKAKQEGQYESLVALGDKLKGLHISDNFGDGAHHHSWPFAGIINFDSILQGLLDVKYDGFFNFEASYTLLHHKNIPYHRPSWVHDGKEVTKLLDPSVELKQKAVDLMYDVGKYMLETYGCFEE